MEEIGEEIEWSGRISLVFGLIFLFLIDASDRHGTECQEAGGQDPEGDREDVEGP